MSLTNDQINELFSFTEKKFVRYYDLQIELVDHLAERIEEEMEKNKSLTFKMALDKIYNGFGIFGFAKIVQQKETEVIKNNNRIWKQAAIKFFTIPKIFFSICLFIGIYQLTGLIVPDYRLESLIIFWLLKDIISIFIIYKHKKKKTKKILLLQDSPYNSIGWFFIFDLFIIAQYQDINRFWLTVAVGAGVITQLCYMELYKKIQSQAVRLYPEVFI